MNILMSFIHRTASPRHFYRISKALTPWLGALCLVLFAVGLYQGLVIAPADYLQGNNYRIMYVHVPSAWMSLMVYMVMTSCAVIHIVWRVKLAYICLRQSAALGAGFTAMALVTGAIWGKPTWGTWWVWDARLTSELILLFIYLGIIAVSDGIEDMKRAASITNILTLIGVVNIPIIHFSVEWWNSLHQPASVSKFSAPSIHGSMLTPLLIMAGAFLCYYVTLLLIRMRYALLYEESDAQWVKEEIKK